MTIRNRVACQCLICFPYWVSTNISRKNKYRKSHASVGFQVRGMLVFLLLRSEKEKVLIYYRLLRSLARLLLLLLLLSLFCFCFFLGFWPHLAFVQRPVFLIILQ